MRCQARRPCCAMTSIWWSRWVSPSVASTAVVRGNDHLSVGLVVQNSLRNRLAIVGAVTDEGLKRGDDLGEQIRHSRRIADLRRGQLAGENLMVFVDRKMEFAPGPGSRNVVLLLMPFVFTVDLQSGGVNDHEATRFHRLAQDVPGQ